MPIFDFKCLECDHEFEEIVFNRDKSVSCPKCESEVKKLPSTFAIRGTGSDGCGSGAGCNCDSCSTADCSSCSCGGH